MDKAELIRNKINIDESKLNGVTFKIADTREELEEAFRIVHDSYVEKGYMTPHPSGMRITIHNANKDAVTFIGKQNGKVIITITLLPDSPLGLPIDCTYNKEIDELRSAGRFVAEVGLLSAHPQFDNKNQNVIMHIYKIMLTYARQYLNVHDLVISIATKHRWFYESMFLFEQIGGLSLFPTVNNTPAFALTRNLLVIEREWIAIYDGKPDSKNLHKFFFQTISPSIELPEKKEPLKILNRDLLSYFFEDRTGLLVECEPQERQFVLSQF